MLLTPQLSDEALLGALSSGVPGGAEAFVRRFQQRVFGLARLIVGDQRQAEDVAQEAMLRAWKSAAAYDPRRGSVAAWLLTITRNLAIDGLRARQARPAEVDASLALCVASGGRDPSDIAADRVEVVQVRAALAQMPPEQARAVFQAVVLGCTAQQVADAEGIPLGTAKTRIRTGMGRLRAALEERRYDPLL